MAVEQSNPTLRPEAAALLASLPAVRGKYTADMALAGMTWFRVGGPADVVFMPADADDLSDFLQAVPDDVPVAILGAGSNTLARDGGVRGVVIKLGAAFGQIEQRDERHMKAGAAALDVRVARAAADAGLSGLEFMSGIPGAIGGALAMNAGAYGSDTAAVLTSVEAMDRQGQRLQLDPAALDLSYRHNGYQDFIIYLGATFAAVPGDPQTISANMQAIADKRGDSQPIKARTGGSTFKNPGGAAPEGPKSWKLIDAAGCRGLRQGDAQVSELHCNFLINHGQASAADLEMLGETVRQRVHQTSGIDLAWEIRRLGEVAHG